MMQTVQSALSTAKTRLQSASDSAALDAQVLLCAVLKVERAYLLAHPEQTLTDDQQTRFDAFIARAADGEPLAYILGRRPFYDRELIVTPDVLIPRPETEHLLEAALAFARQHPGCMAVDIGTGSGALAVTLAALSPSTGVHALDVSPAALNVAQQNAALHQARIQFWLGNLLTPLIEQGIKVDLVMANLPYIATDDLPDLAVTRYEPRLALDGGADGLDLVRRLLEQAPNVCNPGGLILLEIGADQGAATVDLGRAAFPNADVSIIKDLAGLDRIIQIALH